MRALASGCSNLRRQGAIGYACSTQKCAHNNHPKPPHSTWSNTMIVDAAGYGSGSAIVALGGCNPEVECLKVDNDHGVVVVPTINEQT
eukprot:6491073-Amphidinium_carterae.3